MLVQNQLQNLTSALLELSPFHVLLMLSCDAKRRL